MVETRQRHQGPRVRGVSLRAGSTEWPPTRQTACPDTRPVGTRQAGACDEEQAKHRRGRRGGAGGTRQSVLPDRPRLELRTEAQEPHSYLTWEGPLGLTLGTS